jgi:hypothetical protein
MQRGETRAAREMFEKGLALATENRERYQEVRALQYIALAPGRRPAEVALGWRSRHRLGAQDHR